MRQDEAEKLARELRPLDFEVAYGRHPPTSARKVRALCDYVLSSDMKREIENAAFERAATIADEAAKIGMMDSRIEIASRCGMIGDKIRSLIQPPAQKENGE